ncbi:MAG: methyltransferase domain-containing protein [Eubacteriales bacterium]
MPTVITCPVCQLPLVREALQYRCAANHTFDIAKQGYVNLLPPTLGGSDRGDNKAMAAARRDFLNAGYYRNLCSAVSRLAVGVFPRGGVLLDAGCGECYYTDAVTQALLAADRAPCAIGLDISKEALKIAARRPTVRSGQVELLAAALHRMPIAAGSCHLVLNLFAPQVNEAYHRVLAAGGHLLLVIPDARHLWGMKSVLYETPYENQLSPTILSRFTLLEEESIRTTITLQSQTDIQNLFLMTPYYYRTPPKGKEALAALHTLETEIAFRLLLYKKI